MERKSSKEYSVVFLVEDEKFKLRNLSSKTLSLLCSAAKSVGTSLEFAAFGSSPDTKYSRASAFWFFSVHDHGFCGCPYTFSQEKHPHVYLDRAAIDKQSSFNASLVDVISLAKWTSRIAGFDSQRGQLLLEYFKKLISTTEKKCGAPLLGLAKSTYLALSIYVKDKKCLLNHAL